MPPETYDSVWPKPGEQTAASQFVTSDQCLGCHSAGGTGLQYDMTQPGPGGKLINISPYGTWRGSPMGLAGRDPNRLVELHVLPFIVLENGWMRRIESRHLSYQASPFARLRFNG